MKSLWKRLFGGGSMPPTVSTSKPTPPSEPAQSAKATQPSVVTNKPVAPMQETRVDGKFSQLLQANPQFSSVDQWVESLLVNGAIPLEPFYEGLTKTYGKLQELICLKGSEDRFKAIWVFDSRVGLLAGPASSHLRIFTFGYSGRGTDNLSAILGLAGFRNTGAKSFTAPCIVRRDGTKITGKLHDLEILWEDGSATKIPEFPNGDVEATQISSLPDGCGTVGFLLFDHSAMERLYGQQAFAAIFGAMSLSCGKCIFHDGDDLRQYTPMLLTQAEQKEPASLQATTAKSSIYLVGFWTDDVSNFKRVHHHLVSKALPGYLGHLTLPQRRTPTEFSQQMLEWRLPASISLVDGKVVKGTSKYGVGFHSADGDLLRAAERGDVEAARSAISEGADVNCIDPYDKAATPIVHAAWEGHLEIVKLLLDKQANPNARNRGGNTALMLAARRGHIEIIKAIIARGADLNAKLRTGETAVDFAVEHPEIQRLLKHAEMGTEQMPIQSASTQKVSTSGSVIESREEIATRLQELLSQPAAEHKQKEEAKKRQMIEQFKAEKARHRPIVEATSAVPVSESKEAVHLTGPVSKLKSLNKELQSLTPPSPADSYLPPGNEERTSESLYFLQKAGKLLFTIVDHGVIAQCQPAMTSASEVLENASVLLGQDHRGILILDEMIQIVRRLK